MSRTSRLRAEAGFGMVEVLIAAALLVIAILGMFLTFTDSQKLELVSERSTTMAHIAQQEIERLEGIPYAQLMLSSTPSPSTDPKNPDYYVTSGGSFQWDRSGASKPDPLVVDPTNPPNPTDPAPVQGWSEGMFSGSIYDFITWTTDPNCGSGCPSSQDYKRITVAVTMDGELSPGTVWISSVIADPNAAPTGGVVNGDAGNPIVDGTTTCQNSSGQQVTCESPIDLGNPHTYYLHDCAGTYSSCPAPSASNTTHQTVGIASGLTCTPLPSLGTILSEITGCPVPDLMSSTPPPGTIPSTLYQYSTDLGTSGYSGGRILQPLCSNSSGCGTGSSSDCASNSAFTAALAAPQNEFWVSPPLSASLTLNGEGGVSVFSQTQNALSAVVSFCIEIYDVPPSAGTAGSLGDLLAWPPVALGGAGYVAATDPSTNSNWPTSAAGQVSYTFNFRGSNGAVTVPAGDRIGVRVWIEANADVPIALIYDNPAYPSAFELNSQ
jgi:hypothetical protein